MYKITQINRIDKDFYILKANLVTQCQHQSSGGLEQRKTYAGPPSGVQCPLPDGALVLPPARHARVRGWPVGRPLMGMVLGQGPTWPAPEVTVLILFRSRYNYGPFDLQREGPDHPTRQQERWTHSGVSTALPPATTKTSTRVR